MRGSLLAVAAITMLAAASAVLPATSAASAAVRTGLGGNVTVTSVSCAPGGTCAAGGNYLDASFGLRAFVLTELNGQWGTATQVPGLAALSPKSSNILAVSCTAGGCTAGGYYQGQASRYHTFVTSEKNGQWSHLTTVFSVAKKSSAATRVSSLSCSGPENCAVGGGRPFVVGEVNGRWGRPVQFGTEGNNGRAQVSCTSAGDCSASWGTFVVSERNGRWGKPTALPGLSALGTDAAITSLSCTAAVNCTVGGTYSSRRSGIGVFVASKTNGHWGKPAEIPGFAALNQEGFGLLAQVSCASAGNCVAGGSYSQPADFAGGVYEPFVAAEQNGHWGKAIEVPGIPPAGSTLCEPDSSGCVAGQVGTVSCARGGTCAVGGTYDTAEISGDIAFVVSYKSGNWASVTQIPGLEALDTGKHSGVRSVSCTPAGKCVAGGSYATGESAFVTDGDNGTWGQEHTVVIGG